MSFLKHIATLGDDSLAKQVFNTQKEKSFPGFVKNTKTILNDFSLPDITNNNTNIEWSKSEWNNKVKVEVHRKCEKDLQEKIKTMKKLKNGPLNGETFHTKDYLNDMTVEEARVNFKLRTQMLDVKFNYSHDPHFKKELWRCDSFERSIETQSHI